MNIRPTIFLAGLLLALPVLPAQAMTMPDFAVAKASSAPVIQIRGHGHWRHDHRRDHRFHGRDDYYERDDQSGVLFKSFVTGTLFR